MSLRLFRQLPRCTGELRNPRNTFTPPSRASRREPRHQFFPSRWLSYPRVPPKKSSVGSSTLLIGISAAAISLFFAWQSFPSDQSAAKSTFTSQKLAGSETMASSIPPGRHGNLTAEQELKVRELWKSTLRVFGMAGPAGQAGMPSKEEEDETLSPEKKRKRKKSMFSRKKCDEGDAEEDDKDDKYGQTGEFHEALANSTPEQLRASFWSMVKHDHPDDLLLRFLRARKWNVDKALVMLISTMHWRSREMHVDDDIIKNGELASLLMSQASGPEAKEGADFMSQLRMGKSFLHGMDKEGRPLCFVRARLHRQGEQSEASLERYTVHVIETARLLLASPVDTACIIFDMTGFSIANMDYGPVKFMIKCFEANYPESLGAVLVHKAPWVFQGIYKIIKGWLDPVVASKVHFTNNRDELEQFVSPNHIIAELGGDESWTYAYPEPNSDENAKMLDVDTRQRLLDIRTTEVAEFESLTHDWIAEKLEVASVLKQRETVAEKLRTNYWQLDPYIRARTLYDRTGIIGPDGTINLARTENHSAAETQILVNDRDQTPVEAVSRTLVSSIHSPTKVNNGKGSDSGAPTAATGEQDALGHLPDELD